MIFPEARVLITDDMNVNRRIFREIAAPWRLQIDEAADGASAVEAAKAVAYDLIILDQMMPGMTGVEARDEIRKFSATPCVMMTADVSDDMQRICMEHGFADYLIKPIQQAELKRILEKWLPAHKRQECMEQTSSQQKEEQKKENYYKTLEIYIRETTKIKDSLKEYLQNDLAMFRIKVHGIKGTSRQIGKMPISEMAEVMEMAAKLENTAFLERHMDEFLEALELVLYDSKRELDQWKISQEKHRKQDLESNLQEAGQPVDEEMRKEKIHGEFLKLRDSLDSYDINGIEQSMEQLKSLPLSPEEKKILESVEEAYYELEYEEGVTILTKSGLLPQESV